MREEVVAQVVFDLARHADDDPARQELEDALGERHADKLERVLEDLLLSDTRAHVVDGDAQDLGKEDPDGVVQQDRDSADDEAPLIAAEVGEEGLETLEHRYEILAATHRMPLYR